MPDNHAHNKPVSPELIRRYLAGELDDKAMHALEKQALDDPFLAAALEGYTAHEPDQSAHLADLQNRLEQRVNREKGKVRLLYYRWASAAAILLVLGLSFLWINHLELTRQKDIAKVTTTESTAPNIQDSTAALPPAAGEPASGKQAAASSGSTAVAKKPAPAAGTPPPALAGAPAKKDAVQPPNALLPEKSEKEAGEAAAIVQATPGLRATTAPRAARTMRTDTVAALQDNAGQYQGYYNNSNAAARADDVRKRVMVAKERTPEEKLKATTLLAPAARNVVVLGSSTAEGVGPKSKDSTWVSLLRKYLQEKNPQATVTNLAKGGFTSYRILPDDVHTPFLKPDPDREHNITKALALHPDVIIINMPSNDITAGYSLKEYQRNLDAVMEAARRQHVTCYITTTQPRNTDADKRKELLQMRDYIIRRYPNSYIDCWEGLSTPDGSIIPKYNSGDGVHLNGLGHQLMFERIKAKIN
ncbi:MAG TPA: SGNH/GDSL hydrolase family protein [Chitinophaga sp.]|uniref:SGNH/GDSL hydrolase family protein n=1 Tax=Chitinophaga sp. TaxID=1869181 RepID=UPI002DBBDF59|nr:SGNH/GDSL hydrolase family protein [Chitinophaga sp.]HEU4556103.1 SGNH/GDSL hydrolase family protein [Chitinophaga sp.]